MHRDCRETQWNRKIIRAKYLMIFDTDRPMPLESV